ncbi:uncharacterized protein LOC123644131 [Lemur catta]|uniref:uncharacterized protein LOC123644131 n=1 Tax=Lemur catta TaxID=9447 RepID=UPI001E26E5DC|nr:uncharacterized protein LOC123644131 [Lemur catta]
MPAETEKEKLRSCERRTPELLLGGARPARPARPAAVFTLAGRCLFVVLAGRLRWFLGSRVEFEGGGRGDVRSRGGGGGAVSGERKLYSWQPVRDFGLAGPRATLPRPRQALPPPVRLLCAGRLSRPPASRLLPPPLRLLALRSPPAVSLLKNNLCQRRDRRSHSGISAAPPLPAGAVSRLLPPPHPRPPTAALFCLRPLFPLGLTSCGCHLYSPIRASLAVCV